MQEICKDFFSGWTLAEWQSFYRGGTLEPRDILAALDIKAGDPAWITQLDESKLQAQIDELADISFGGWRAYLVSLQATT